MGHRNPIKEVQRRFAANPPASWIPIADAIADHGYARAARKRDRQAQRTIRAARRGRR